MIYPGGKNGAGVYHRIIREMPAHTVYYEPFLGSGACLRHKKPALLNLGGDLDSAVLRRWGFGITGPVFSAGSRRASLDGIMTRSYSRIPVLSSTWECGFAVVRTMYQHVEPYRKQLEPDDSFPFDGDGLRRGEVPPTCARYALGRVDAFKALAQVSIGAGISLLSFAPGRTLIYCDPPYLPESRTKKHVYGEHELSFDQHVELVELLRALPCLVMISGYASDLYADRLKHWRCVKFDAMTRGGVRLEHLWCNFDPPKLLHDSRFAGLDFRERERIKRKKDRWVQRLRAMSASERQALLDAISESGVDPGRK